MKVTLYLIDRKKPSNKQVFDAEIPAIPRQGEVILVGEATNYEVKDIVYHFDDEGRFTNRITIDAWSLWNTEAEVRRETQSQ